MAARTRRVAGRRRSLHQEESLNEIAIYAVETKAIIQILWGLLLITAITLVSVSIMYVLLRLKLRSYKRREAQLARHISTKADEIAKLEEKLAQYVEIEDGVDELKAEVRRADAIRSKTEGRLVAQNAELEAARAELAGQAAELARLHMLVEHIDDL
jgi:septal ring factor EnvC (AmiA/AmiB activator)